MSNFTEEQSQTATEQAKERVQDATQQVKTETRQQFRSQINDRSTQVGEQAVAASQAVRRASDQLRNEGNERAAGMIDAVADRGERLGAYLRNSDGDQIVCDVEAFARRKPWLMVSASAVAGFLASRFVKASSRERYRRSGGYPSTRGSSSQQQRGRSGPSVQAGYALPVGTGGTGQ